MRSWLIKTTIVASSLFVLSFVFIFVRGMVWSPNTIKDSDSNIELGTTALIQHQGQRLWSTRLLPEQRLQLEKINDYVFVGGGCDIQTKRCLLESKTNRQGVIIRYLESKPDIFKNQIPWAGGFINPTNGAIYDLLGRLYRANSNSEKVLKFIDYRQP